MPTQVHIESFKIKVPKIKCRLSVNNSLDEVGSRKLLISSLPFPLLLSCSIEHNAFRTDETVFLRVTVCVRIPQLSQVGTLCIRLCRIYVRTKQLFSTLFDTYPRCMCTVMMYNMYTVMYVLGGARRRLNTGEKGYMHGILVQQRRTNVRDRRHFREY